MANNPYNGTELPALGLSAYFLGLRIAGQRKKAERVPAAYLYNSVRLPKIPDVEGYPYKLLIDRGGDLYWVFNTQAPMIVEHDGLYDYVYSENALNNWFMSQITVGYDNEWYVSKGGNFSKDPNYVETLFKHTFIWSNHDVLSTDGSLCVAASDPVPIYE